MFWARVHVDVCFGPECLCDIRPMSLALYIISHSYTLTKMHHRLQTKSDERIWGARTPQEGKGAKQRRLSQKY